MMFKLRVKGNVEEVVGEELDLCFVEERNRKVKNSFGVKGKRTSHNPLNSEVNNKTISH